MDYKMLFSDSADDILSTLIHELDKRSLIDENVLDLISDLDYLDSTSDSLIKADEANEAAFNLIKHFCRDAVVSDNSITIPVIANYSETGEGPLRYTNEHPLVFQATGKTGGLYNNAYIFLSFNQENTVDIVSCGFNAWYTCVSIPVDYQFDQNEIVIKLADINASDLSVLGHFNDQTERRFNFYTRLGTPFNPYELLSEQIKGVTSLLIVREALDMVRNRDFNAATLQAKLDKYGGYAALPTDAKEVYNDIVSAMSTRNPFGVIALVKDWLLKSETAGEDPSFSDVPAFIKGFCLTAILDTVINGVVAIAQIVTAFLGPVVAIITNVVCGVFQTIWNVLTNTTNTEYDIIWSKDTSLDTDTRTLEVPFARGFMDYPSNGELKELLSKCKVVKAPVPGCEMLLWDYNGDETRFCYEIRPSLNFNAFNKVNAKTLIVNDAYSYSNNTLLFNAHDDLVTVCFNTANVKTFKEAYDSYINECFDPIITCRDIPDEEIELRIASGLLLFGLWIQSVVNPDGSLIFGLNNGYTYAAHSNKNYYDLDQAPIYCGLGAVAMTVYNANIYNSSIPEGSEYYYLPFEKIVNTNFSTQYINDIFVTLANKKLNLESYQDSSAQACVNWCNNLITKPFQGGYTTQSFASELNGALPSAAVSNSNADIHPHLTISSQLPSLFLGSVTGDLENQVLVSSFKGVAFCKIPAYTTAALIASAAVSAVVATAVAVGAVVAYKAIQRSVTKKQFARQPKLEQTRRELIDAAARGDKAAYKQAYKSYRKQARTYNLMSTLTGLPKYDKGTGFYNYPVSDTAPYPSSEPFNSTSSDMTLDVIHTVICGY